MDVWHAAWCGLDGHTQTVVACLLRTEAGGRRSKGVRTFGATTGASRARGDRLGAGGCPHVALESTGAYWKPVPPVLGATCGALLVNAQHVKAAPGRKPDVADGEW